MELNALTRWDSVGKDLVNLDKIQQELETLQQKGVIHENDWKELRKVLSQPDIANILTKKRPSLAPTISIRTSKPKRNKWISFLIWGVRRFAKGFSIGFGLSVALSLLKVIFKTANPFALFRALGSLVATPEPWRYGAFLGSFFCVFESVMRICRYYHDTYHHSSSSMSNSSSSHHHSTKTSREHDIVEAPYRAIVSGALAGMTLFFVPRASRLAICLFFLVRALELFCRILVEKQMLPAYEHADTLVMALASAQVVWGTLAGSETLDPNYRRFMDVHTGKPVYVKSLLRNVMLGEPITSTTLTSVNEWRQGVGWPALQIPTAGQNLQQYTCDLLHHGTSCTSHFLSFFLAAIRRSIPVYLPVYLVPLVLFRFKKIFSQPFSTLGHATLGIGQSAVFLATYCSSSFYALCLLRHLTSRAGVLGHLQAHVAGFVGGHAVLIEKKSRRIELALYVLSHALQSFARAHPRLMPNLPQYEVLLFALSSATIMYAYTCRPKLLRPSYFTLVRFMFGSGGEREGFPKALPPSATSPHHSGGIADSKRFQSTPNMSSLRSGSGLGSANSSMRKKVSFAHLAPPTAGPGIGKRTGHHDDEDDSGGSESE